jgi:hypothetical protein
MEEKTKTLYTYQKKRLSITTLALNMAKTILAFVLIPRLIKVEIKV